MDPNTSFCTRVESGQYTAGIPNSFIDHPKMYPVGWSCRIRWLYLWRELGPSNKYPGYDIEYGETPVMPEHVEYPPLPLHPGPLLPGMYTLDRVLSLSQTEPFEI